MTSLFDEAQKKLTQNDYVGAREAYRNAALREKPNTLNLTLLNFAEQHECLTFRHELRLRYPQSLSIWAVEIGCLYHLGRYEQVIALCTEALYTFLDIDDQYVVRPYRLQAACRGDLQQNIQLILEDIRVLWQTADDFFFEDRKNLLRTLFSSLDSKHLPILETLAHDELFPPIVRQAFEAKIAQLRAFEEALKAL